jgi:hypothetical protein
MFRQAVCATIAIAAVPGAAKDTRDAFDVAYSVVESDNFAVKYDSDHAVDESHVAALLEALEGAAAVFHGELGHRQPTFAAQFRVNAYIAGPTSVPDIPIYGGYMTFDDDGAPILVFSQDLLTSGDPGLRLVAAHEYYHAIQLSTAAFADTADSSWYFEASANWAAHVADPDDDVVFGDAGTWLAALEHAVTLDSNTMADDDPRFGHEYGVFLLPLCVSLDTSAADVAAIWEGAGPDDDALDALAAVAGVDAGLVVARCGARLARWDFPEPIRSHLETWLPVISPFDIDTAPATLAITDVGLSVDVGAESGKALHAWGMHVVSVPPHAGVVSISLVGPDDERSSATAERLPLVAVAARADGSVDDFVVDGDALVYDATGRGVLAVVVVAAPDERDPAAVYPNVITVDGVPFEDIFSAEPPTPSCGCTSAAPADVALAAVVVVAGGCRRRRRR